MFSSRPRCRPAAKLTGAVVLAIGAVAGGLGCCVFSAEGYRGPVSDHFDGERFVNQAPRLRNETLSFLKWMLARDPGPWGEVPDTRPGPAPIRRNGPGDMRVTFVNHATVLVQMDGLNILTDPIWSERPTPVPGFGPLRARPPGIRFEDLPPIDVVLISHNHYDHMDVPTLERLVAAHRPRIFVGLGNQAFLTGKRIPNVKEYDWWDAEALRDGVTVTCVPAQHFAMRGLCDRDNTLWAGWVVSGPSGTMYFAGDTGWGPHFQQVRERLGQVRLALLPIGAFRPEWFMAPVHISPAQALEAHGVLGAGTSVGIHFGTFRLADDGREEPGRVIAAKLAVAPEPKPHFWVLGFGEGRDVPPLPATAAMAAAPPVLVPGAKGL